MTEKKPYLVSFFKTVITSYGNDHEICQRTVEVTAADEDEALQQAKDELCRAERLVDWSQHADRYELEYVDLRHRPPASNSQARRLTPDGSPSLPSRMNSRR